MKERALGCLLIALMLTLGANVGAQSYITARAVFLRGSPSKTGAKLRELKQGDTVTRRTQVAAKPGWLPARTLDGKAGWVGIVHLRNLEIVTAAGATVVETDTGCAAFTRIDTSWTKPALVRSTIMVQGGAKSCVSTGDASNDDGTNLHKTRADFPDSSHLVTVDAIRSLPDTALWRFTNRRHWTREDSLLVIPYEGIPVTVEGSFEVVKAAEDECADAGAYGWGVARGAAFDEWAAGRGECGESAGDGVPATRSGASGAHSGALHDGLREQAVLSRNVVGGSSSHANRSIPERTVGGVA